MLNVPKPETGQPYAYAPPVPYAYMPEPEQGQFVDFDRLLAAARRQIWVLAACVLLSLGLGVFYLLTAIPFYTASIDILIDKGRMRVIDQLTPETGIMQDEAETLSQIELLKSEALARNVVARLKLTENREFIEQTPSMLSFAVGGARELLDYVSTQIAGSSLTASDQQESEKQRVQRAVETLRDNTEVERVGRTYVLRLRYESPSPGLSAAIAGAFGEAYLEDQLQSKFDATKRAGIWLQDRIGELREQAFGADIKVQQFRIDNNLMAAGGKLVSEQQLAEINTQLIAAQAATAEARARLDQLEGLIKSGRTDAVVNDALVSTTINSLRERYLNTSRIKAEIEAKLGPEHIQVKRLNGELRELERLIFSELERIAESYRSSYNVALSRENSLRQSMEDILNVNAVANTTQVELRELEREAEAYRTLYESFLRRHQETVQQQTFPISNARVISPAQAPKQKSSPKTTVSLALFLFAGLAAGAGIGALREFRDRFFRTAEQVRNETHGEFLGYIPVIKKVAKSKNDLWKRGSLNAYVRSHPFTSFAETLRNVKVAADTAFPQSQAKVIGIVSCLPGEGKSTVSANLAQLLAQQGARVALVDGDLRNPGLSRNLATRPQSGLIEALMDDSDAEPAPLLLRDPSTHLTVVPTILNRRVSHTSELLASSRMNHVLSRLKDEHDYVIIDLPPTGPVVDAKAFAHRIDAFVFVVEWGRTPRALVRNTLEQTAMFSERCLGIILNKSDQRRMKLYRSYEADAQYYSSRYKSYYQS